MVLYDESRVLLTQSVFAWDECTTSTVHICIRGTSKLRRETQALGLARRQFLGGRPHNAERRRESEFAAEELSNRRHRLNPHEQAPGAEVQL